MILLISPNKNLSKPVAAALPDSVTLVHSDTVAAARPYLNPAGNNSSEIILIIIDATVGQAVVSTCRHMCQGSSKENIPIIAIIAEAGARESILAAGANDYLLQPLLTLEIKARLAIHLHTSLHGFSSLVESIQQAGIIGSSNQELNQRLKSLAQLFNAPAAWLLLLDDKHKQVRVISSYNLPPLFQEEDITLEQETLGCLEIIRGERSEMPRVIACPYLAQANAEDRNSLTHHLSIPINSRQRLRGVLNLAYPETPAISWTEMRILTILGRDVGILLEMIDLQEEMQTHATQNAFIVLLARMISERLDLNTILALTLEQAVPLLNATRGEVCLLSPDRQWLELVSTLSSQMSPSRHQPVRWEKRRGLKGWVIDHNQPLQLQIPTDDPRFEPEVDQVEGMTEYAWLTVPLQHRSSTIGTLTIHRKNGDSFGNRDIELLKGIASLTASAIVNAQLMQELREHADQQRVLYEMSQQVAAGLDLPTTLNRIFHWLGRLFAAEIGTLWLVENAIDQATSNEKTLRLVTALGLDLPENQKIIFSLEQGVVGWVVRTGEAAMVNKLTNEPRFDYSVSEMLNFLPRNIIAVPMIYHDQTIGAICLLNKIGDSFTEADLTLLSTVVDIVAVAVGNARLHTQTVTLMAERERLNKQILQSERLATVGRLTASLSHEINNPMQAIQGALTLALEELDSPQDLKTYLQMSLKESERVVQLITRLRQIYRPQAEAPEEMELNHLLQEVAAIARKELKRRQVKLEVDLTPHLPLITAIPNQLHLVFLNLVLNLGDAIGTTGGGNLTLQSSATVKHLTVKLTTSAPSITLPDISQQEMSSSLGLSLSYDIVAAHGGALHFSEYEQQIVCQIELPLSPPKTVRVQGNRQTN